MFKDFENNKILKEINDSTTAILFHLKKLTNDKPKKVAKKDE